MPATLHKIQDLPEHVARLPRPLPQRVWLDAEPISVRIARAYVIEFLRERGLGGIGEAAELWTAEVFTNAVLHAAPAADEHTKPIVWLYIRVVPGMAVIYVEGVSKGVPVLIDAELDDEHGRGFKIASAIADQCGYFPLHNRGAATLVVWGVLRAPALPQRRRCGAGGPEPHAPVDLDAELIQRLLDGLRALPDSPLAEPFATVA